MECNRWIEKTCFWKIITRKEDHNLLTCSIKEIRRRESFFYEEMKINDECMSVHESSTSNQYSTDLYEESNESHQENIMECEKDHN